MDDSEIMAKIHALVDEEHTLERRAGSEHRPADRERLRAIEVMLDQCWDLMRQRYARRSVGLDPDEAHMRDPAVVEHYRQ
jgi:hypothetical protein